MAEQTPHQCPHLGILDDPDTSHSFPSTWNACFHAKIPSVPNFEHQEKICLTDGYVSCPVYQSAKGSVFPAELLNTVKPPKKEKVVKPVFAYILGAVLLVGITGGLVVLLASRFPERAGFSVPGLNPSETAITATDTAVIQATATLKSTLAPTLTIAVVVPPTSEPTPEMIKPYVLETPFKIGEQDFLIHRVKDGDGLDILAKTYHTTSEVIQASNYAMKIPIWAGSLMLIRPDIVTLDPAEPIFEIYIVADKAIMLDELAKRLNVDLTRLKYYNACADRCMVSRDDWVLVPRHP